MPKSTQLSPDVRLDGKTVLVTGANTGIGKETVRDLAKRGALVILGCRNEERGQEAIKDMVNNDGVKEEMLVFYQLDLASFASIKAFAAKVLEKHEKIHILINNAGVMMTPEWKTKENFEMQFGVNHVGHFLLTSLLLDRIKTSAPARIVVVSSMGHKYGKINFDDLNFEKGYSAGKAYAQSKLANILFVKQLAENLKDTGVSTFSLHPGVIDTELNRHVGESVNRFVGWVYRKISPYIFKNSKDGAKTTIYCAVTEGIEDLSGSYFSDCAVATPSAEAQNMETTKKLWETTEILIKEKESDQ